MASASQQGWFFWPEVGYYMEFSIATLLPLQMIVAAKVLEKTGLPGWACFTKLHIAPDVLEKVGILVKDQGWYRWVQEEDVIGSKTMCSSKGLLLQSTGA